jgi:hypothetical protein
MKKTYSLFNVFRALVMSAQVLGCFFAEASLRDMLRHQAVSVF